MLINSVKCLISPTSFAATNFAFDEPFVMLTKYSLDSFIVDGYYRELGTGTKHSIKMRIAACKQSMIYSEQVAKPTVVAVGFAANSKTEYFAPVEKVDPSLNPMPQLSNALLCITNPNIPTPKAHRGMRRVTSGSTFQDLMMHQRESIISFWMSSKLTPKDLKHSPNIVTGKIIVGGRNTGFMNPESTVSFSLLRPLMSPVASPTNPYDLATKPISINVLLPTGKSYTVKYPVKFVIDDLLSFLPRDVFEAMLGELKDELLNKTNGLPANIVDRIEAANLDPTEVSYFHCGRSYKIAPIRIGDMVIRAEKWFVELLPGLCKLNVKPSTADLIVLGMNLLRKYHITIGFPSQTAPFIEVSRSLPGSNW